jgi:two-component system chemotaxis response regulator CheB
LHLVEKLRPDLITMDVTMPKMDGVAATRQIMSTFPTPIAVITSCPVGPSAPTTFNAVAAGAVDVFQKPSRDEFNRNPSLRDTFVRQLRNVGYVGVVGIRGQKRPTERPPASANTARLPVRSSLIAIGASTGGPPTIRSTLSLMDPEKCPPVVIVQHMSADFLVSFATWLDGVCPLKVTLAQKGKPMKPGHAYVAPGDSHLTVNRHGMALNEGAPVHFQKPSVDILFESVARSHGDSAIGILLTGMGRDGAQGLLKMSQTGACAVTQDEESSLVYGMPRAAVELGASCLSAPPGHIARLLARIKHLPQ